MSEFAPGLPSKQNISSVPRINEPLITDFGIQRHITARNNPHYDLRIKMSDGKAHSWVIKNLATNPGDKVLAVKQPDHTAEYMSWSGTIPSGYGKGDVELFQYDKVEVTKSEPDKVSFNVYKSNADTERYVLIRTSDDQWLLHNVTPTRKTRPEIPSEKPSYKSIDIDAIDVNNQNQVLAPKVDGALNVFLLRRDKPIELYSYRPSAKGESKLIDHTFRSPTYKTIVPKGIKGSTVLLGEVYAKDKDTDQVLSSRDTAARLLSNVWRSRELQKQAPLQNMVFNVLRYQGRDVSDKPYVEKLQILKRITNAIPQLKMPPLSASPEQKQELLRSVKEGTHPLSREGVVVYDINQSTPLKAKLQEDYDIHIRDIFPGEGKYKGKAAGGFTFSYKPSGPIIGRVGSGFDDATRKHMQEHPEEWRGQVARVWAQEKLPSGALRMPVFKDIRSEMFSKTAHLGMPKNPSKEFLLALIKKWAGSESNTEPLRRWAKYRGTENFKALPEKFWKLKGTKTVYRGTSQRELQNGSHPVSSWTFHKPGHPMLGSHANTHSSVILEKNITQKDVAFFPRQLAEESQGWEQEVVLNKVVPSAIWPIAIKPEGNVNHRVLMPRQVLSKTSSAKFHVEPFKPYSSKYYKKHVKPGSKVFRAYLGSQTIGEMIVDKNNRVVKSELNRKFQRKGYGSRMYLDIIKKKGISLYPGKSQSEGAKALWAKIREKTAAARPELLPYQEDLKRKLQNQHGAVVAWGLGSGKTIGSIAAADQFGETRAVVPASLRENFKKGLREYKPTNKFSVESYEHFLKNPSDLSNQTVIFDEAHRLRTSGSKRSQLAQILASRAKKAILLTGTPIQNAPHEIAPLINIAAGQRMLPTSEKDFNARYVRHEINNPGLLRKLFGAKKRDEYHINNVEDFKRRTLPYIVYNKGQELKDMPKVEQHRIEVEMSPTQTNVYKAMESRLPSNIRKRIEESLPAEKRDIGRLNSFLSATRQISNTSEKFYREGGEKEYSPKLKSIAERIQKNPGKSLVYSNYLESGVNPLSELLTKAKISHGTFTGHLGDKSRKNLVHDYNTNKLKALIVSSSGGEGLDLKGTREVFITEPHWNEAKIDQVIGRSARLGSHSRLPETERKIDVYKYLSTLPAKRSGFLWLKKKRPISADQYLENMSTRKAKLNEEFTNVLKEKTAGINMTKAESILQKLSGVNWGQMGKEFVVPSLVAGPIIGAGVTAATSKSKDDFNKNIKKGIVAGVVGDVATGAALGLWNQRKTLLKKAEIYMTTAPRTQNVYEDVPAATIEESDLKPQAYYDPHAYKKYMLKELEKRRLQKNASSKKPTESVPLEEEAINKIEDLIEKSRYGRLLESLEEAIDKGQKKY
jgi:superfamily II DNA or RNA helicase